jgi:hypothetical protein
MAVPFIGIFSDAFKATWKNKRLWLLHFFINAAIATFAVLWLRIPDASAWQLLFAALSALILVVAALWLHAGTLAYFLGAHGASEASLAAGFKTGRRNLAGFALWSAIFVFLVYLVLVITGPAADTDAFASWLRSIMPAFLRRQITLATVDSVVSWTICLVLFVLLPGLLLPFAVQFAGQGFAAFRSGFKAWKQTVSKISYWLWLCILALLGIYLPHRIANWVPNFSSLPLEHFSLAVRLALAFALTVTAWLMLASMLGRLGSGAGGESPGGDAAA